MLLDKGCTASELSSCGSSMRSKLWLQKVFTLL